MRVLQAFSKKKRYGFFAQKISTLPTKNCEMGFSRLKKKF